MAVFRSFLALAMMAAAGPVHARIVTIIYSGILAGAQDDTGMFGAPNTLLTGLRYQSVYRFDTEKIGATRTATATGEILEGTGIATPLLDAFLTINGRSVAVSGELRSRRIASNDATASTVTDVALGAYSIGSVSYNRQLVDTIQASVGMLPGMIDTPFSYGVIGRDFASGGFFFEARDILTFATIESARGSYVPQSIEVRLDAISSPGVPEPAGWAMMIAGFGLVGAAMRRRALQVPLA